MSRRHLAIRGRALAKLADAGGPGLKKKKKKFNSIAGKGRCTLETAMARQSAGKQTLRIEGVDVPVSNLDKLLYPAAGVTKAQVIDYYIRVSQWLLPHLRDRPVTLKRYPDGVQGEHFYEKDAPSFTPEWVQPFQCRGGPASRISTTSSLTTSPRLSGLRISRI